MRTREGCCVKAVNINDVLCCIGMTSIVKQCCSCIWRERVDYGLSLCRDCICALHPNNGTVPCAALHPPEFCFDAWWNMHFDWYIYKFGCGR